MVDAPTPPECAGRIFGARLPLAQTYAGLLADTGVGHGLIGPREVPRLWDRHLLNCAVIEDAFPHGAVVADLGSGAGLPGIPLAIARPDLIMHLVEPMQRRTEWLRLAVAGLGLDNVTVHRGRAEELRGELVTPYVTARAVARLATLATWTREILEPGGLLVAMKGARAQTELEEDRARLARLGVTVAVVTTHGDGVVEAPVRTVDLRFRPDRPPVRGRRVR